MGSKRFDMRSSPRVLPLLTILFAGLLLSVSSSLETFAQKTPGSNSEAEEASIKTVTSKEIKTVIRERDKGYLSLIGVRDAQVTLSPLGKGKVRNEKITEDDGTLNFVNLPPGKYKVEIQHPDYQPISGEVVTIGGGKLVSCNFSGKLVSIYGRIQIVEVTPGAAVRLDGKELDQASLKVEGQNLMISRIPVGPHRLEISKEGYEPHIESALKVGPVDPVAVPGKLQPATITVIFESLPDAKLYVDGQERGSVDPKTRKVTISLPPKSYSMRLKKDGYEEWAEEMALSLEKRTVTKEIKLLPIPESAEGDWSPEYESQRWTPESKAWLFDNTGAHVRGDALVLYANDGNRSYNFYKSFTLTFQFQFDGKGAAWVIRASDRNNYYLFELNAPQSANPNAFIIFYACQNGVLKEKERKVVPGSLTKNDQFRITVEAHGGQFTVWLRTNNPPTLDSKGNKIGDFPDQIEALSVGGVGFRVRGDFEMLLKAFNVRPIK